MVARAALPETLRVDAPRLVKTPVVGVELPIAELFNVTPVMEPPVIVTRLEFIMVAKLTTGFVVRTWGATS